MVVAKTVVVASSTTDHLHHLIVLPSRATHIMPSSPPIMLCSSSPSLSYYSFPVATY